MRLRRPLRAENPPVVPRLGLAGGGHPGRQPGGSDQALGAVGPLPVRPGGEFPQLAAHARRAGRARSVCPLAAGSSAVGQPRPFRFCRTWRPATTWFAGWRRSSTWSCSRRRRESSCDRVAPKTWEAYDLTARKGCPAPRGRRSVRHAGSGTVYQAKSSVDAHASGGGPQAGSRRSPDMRTERGASPSIEVKR